jgi:hypothetical protein
MPQLWPITLSLLRLNEILDRRAIDFGYYPHQLDFSSGPVTVSTLADFDEIVSDISNSETLDGDWIYPGAQLVQNLGDPIRERPYAARLFSLPMTHKIEHAASDSQEHIDFHIWALSFFVGMRLSSAPNGFIDSTPIKSGKLVDFVLLGRGIEAVSPLAETFWQSNQCDPSRIKRWVAAVHTLFIGQHPQSLQFERFIYLYTALDACFALANAQTKHVPHSKRIDWMCQQYGMETPSWAEPAGTKSTQISAIRNPALHEGLFVNEPLGFAIHGGGSNTNLTLEMQALVCRFLAILIGVTDSSYTKSQITTRQRQGLRL